MQCPHGFQYRFDSGDRTPDLRSRPVGTSPKQAKQKWDARGLVKRVVAEKERTASSPPRVSVFASVFTNSGHAHYYLVVWNSLRSSTTDWSNPANRLYGLIAFRCRHKEQLSSEDDWWRKVAVFFCQSMDRFHMTSRRPLVHETMKRLPCWCIEKILWVFNSFLM